MNTNEYNWTDDISEGTFVTAIKSFKGTSERGEHDLHFEQGDVLRILNKVQDDPKWAFADLNKKLGFIPLNYVKPIDWFHGKVTREQAEFLLNDTHEGSFLIRESTHFPGDYTLCVKSESKIENYRIKRIKTEDIKLFTIDDEVNFSNLIKLVLYYENTQDLACLLKKAIKIQKRVEIDDFKSISSSEIEFKKVIFGKEIGIGDFGVVYKGSYNGYDVAIKAIKDPSTIKDFCKEAVVMAALNHPNLVKFIGVTFKPDRSALFLVTEYMPKGCLLDYLMSRGRNVLTKKELIQFSIHICEGMSYLEQNGIVHRDLAASNVLISEENIAKVSDFGLAKKIMDVTNAVRIRIKWTAPEALKSKNYSNKSDMWSFGILLWEIFSYGRVPYPKIPVNDVQSYVEKGNKMEKPEGCPDDIYSLMKHAWDLEPTLRPTFKETVHNLKELHKIIHD